MWGGKRSGAGRRKGAPNTATAARQAAISASGEAPLDYMIRIMRDESAPTERRDDMAKAAAPYIHPRLSSTEATVTVNKRDATDWTRDELVAFLNNARASGNGAAAPGSGDDKPDRLH